MTRPELHRREYPNGGPRKRGWFAELGLESDDEELAELIGRAKCMADIKGADVVVQRAIAIWGDVCEPAEIERPWTDKKGNRHTGEPDGSHRYTRRNVIAADYTERSRIWKRAYAAVAKALKSGELVRPVLCEQCRTVGQIEAAHSDYDRPLDVRWLCQPCHRRWDAAQPKSAA